MEDFFPLPYPGQHGALPGHFDIVWSREKDETSRGQSVTLAAQEVSRRFYKWLPHSDYTAHYHPSSILPDSHDLFWNKPEKGRFSVFGQLANEFGEALRVDLIFPWGTIPPEDDENWEAQARMMGEKWKDRLWPKGIPPKYKKEWRMTGGTCRLLWTKLIMPDGTALNGFWDKGSNGFPIYSEKGGGPEAPGINYNAISFSPRCLSSNQWGSPRRLQIHKADERGRAFCGKKALYISFPTNDMHSFSEKYPHDARAIAVALRFIAGQIDKTTSKCRQYHTPPHKMAIRCIVLAWWLKAGGPLGRFDQLAHLLNLNENDEKDCTIKSALSPDLYLLLKSGVFSKTNRADTESTSKLLTNRSLSRHFK